MTAMNHAEAEEFLGAYALDALTRDERQRMEEHLGSCEEHRDAAAELRATASLLALTVEDRDPSPALRRRIIDAAVEVFADKGFFGARISEIAEVAGVADGTIYLYFDGK